MGADGTPTTRIDLAAEDAIVEVLKADGRSMRIISEELGELILGDSPEFSIVLDPLDGTYNSSVGIPFYSVSIAVASYDLSDLRFGYVSNLALCEEYYAEAGKGAYLNGKKIKTSLNSESEGTVCQCIRLPAKCGENPKDIQKCPTDKVVWECST